MAQVSINISDFEETPVHIVYEEVCKEAKVATRLSARYLFRLIYVCMSK